MSHLLLEIDENVCLYQGKYYTSYEGQNVFFDRYLRVFDSLRVVSRCEEIESVGKKQQLIDRNRIQIVPVPMFRGIAQFLKFQPTIKKLLDNVAEGCDSGVLRIPSALAMKSCKELRKCKKPYAVEIVYDAQDGYNNADTLLENIAWRYQHYLMKKMANHAIGVSCVTEFYLQKHYFSKEKNHFNSNYSTLALPAAFYSGPRKYPQKDRFVISHIANQIMFKGRKGHNEVIDAVALLKEQLVKAAPVDFFNPAGQGNSLC